MSSLPPEVPNAGLSLALHKLREAGQTQQAHSAMCLQRNTPSPDLAPEAKLQRTTILDISARLLHASILSQYDEACVEYLRVRGLMK